MIGPSYGSMPLDLQVLREPADASEGYCDA
jgi:hypothetical protein